MSERSDPHSAKGAAAPRSWALTAGLAAAAVGAAALLYVVFAAASKPDQAGYARFAQGPLARLAALDDAPPQPLAVLRDSDGRELTLQAFRGELVLLNIWATWCAPCRAEMPTLARLQTRYHDRGLSVIAVSIDAEADWAKAEAMLDQLSGGALDFYAEPTRAIAFAVRAPGMPTSILYDRDGAELARVPGGADWASPEAAALIEAALAEE